MVHDLFNMLLFFDFLCTPYEFFNVCGGFEKCAVTVRKLAPFRAKYDWKAIPCEQFTTIAVVDVMIAILMTVVNIESLIIFSPLNYYRCRSFFLQTT
mmetsp:Transcript_2501/g.2890  ORF Transcript_2501/g.2890 Transcript_2501/m.2890 type:complete len:97 (+) Transcript_2501:720-1010(+)